MKATQGECAHEGVSGGALRPVLAGAGAGAALLGVYFALVSWTASAGHAVEELFSIWRWVAPLTLGFGLQAGLYAHIRLSLRERALSRTLGPGVAATGGVSTASMVACCAHHLTDVLPLMGLPAAALFLERYQRLFFAAGIASSVVGTLVMLSMIQRHRLYLPDAGWLRWLMWGEIRKALAPVVVLSAVGVAVAWLVS